jgi:hypothetical protein
VAERVLTLKELNRATLARQLLLQRRRASASDVIEQLAGMQAQWPPAPYVGIWSRATSFRREKLEQSLLAADVVKASLMRNTLHLVTRRDYPVFWTALHDIPSWPDPTAIADGVRIAPLIRELALAGPLRSQDGLAYLEREHGLVDVHRKSRVFHVARTRSHVTHAPQTALWSSRPLGLFAPLDEPEPVEKLVAVRDVVRRYLAAFGPASRADIATWSGMRIADFAPALETLEPLRRFRDERGRELLDVEDGRLPDPETPAPPRFLPEYDNVGLSHADRARLFAGLGPGAPLPRGGRAIGTLLVDGFYRANWQITEDGDEGTLTIDRFVPDPGDPPGSAEAIATEGEGLLAFLTPGAAARRVRFVPDVA